MRAARAAGKVLREKFDATREISTKGKRDIVTDADYAAERAVREALLTRFPQDHFLSEESDVATRRALWSQAEASDTLALWVVDPLDGTTNYAHRVPVFSVSIALVRAQAVQLGVVYDPLLDELFSAERGQGAYLNGKRIGASSTRAFRDAVIGLEWARAQALRERTAALLAQMAAGALTARTTGSAALSLCYIAAGRFDAYFHFSLSPWDVAAAALIIEEAGGRVTTPAGAAWSVHSQAYVASNGLLHSTMLRFFK
jgi:myo-inositol-1(or 4)-monophosphatase